MSDLGAIFQNTAQRERKAAADAVEALGHWIDLALKYAHESGHRDRVDRIRAAMHGRRCSLRIQIDADYDSLLSFKLYAVTPDGRPEEIIDAACRELS